MRRLIAHLTLALTIFLQPTAVMAQDITLIVEGNGEGSSNSVSVEESNENNVEQSNDTEVVNEVEVNSDTGNNEANSNTDGNASIDTGNSSSDVVIVNEGINHNVIDDQGCNCDADTQVYVGGNGSDSTNTVEVSSDVVNNISQNNEALINNNVVINANTGNNTANSNTGGNVDINTGNIYESTAIANQYINQSYLALGAQGINADGAMIAVAGNGAGSNNQIVFNISENNQINVNNVAVINNNIFKNLNTGGNSANGNTGGNVQIGTGNIVSLAAVVNGPINSSYVSLGHFCDVSGVEDPGDPGTGGPGGGGDDGGGNNSGSGGSSSSSSSSSNNDNGGIGGGDILGAMLPDTGGNFANLMALNAILLGVGILLRTQVWKAANVFKRDYELSFALVY